MQIASSRGGTGVLARFVGRTRSACKVLSRISSTVLPPTGWNACQRLVEHGTQAVDVGAIVKIAVHADLFRRHVGDRPLQAAVQGQRQILHHGAWCVIRFSRRRPLGVPDLGQAPIQHEHLAEGADEDVLGLDVPVRDAVPVRVLQRMGDLDDDFDETGEVVALAVVEHFPQRVSMHHLHGEVVVALEVAAEFVGGNRVGVLEHGRHPGLAHETSLLVRIPLRTPP